MVFLLIYVGFLLFDYHPEVKTSSTVIMITVGNKNDFIKVTITELLIIICVSVYLVGEVREVKLVSIHTLLIFTFFIL